MNKKSENCSLVFTEGLITVNQSDPEVKRLINNIPCRITQLSVHKEKMRMWKNEKGYLEGEGDLFELIMKASLCIQILYANA